MGKHGKHKKKKKGSPFPFNIDKDLVPVFSTGFYPQHESLENPHGEVDVALLHDLADSYDPDGFMAPITVDHDQEGTAKGWIDKFKVIGDKLFMKVKSVTDEFAQALEDGKFLYPSIELYPPEMGSNPAPGHWYVKAVTFLGAAAPQVKGLFAGFSEAWVATAKDGSKILCFSELNRNEDYEMTPEEIKKLVAESVANAVKAAVKDTTETLTKQFSEDLDDKLKERDDDHKQELDDIAAKEKKDKRTDAAKFSEMQTDVSTTSEELRAMKKQREDDQHAGRVEKVEQFTETLKRDGYMKPATVDDKVKPRLTAQLSNPDGLQAVMDSIMDGATKGSFFREIASDPEQGAKDSGIALTDEARIRHFSEKFGVQNATKESANLARSGAKLFRERVAAGATSSYVEQRSALIDAEKAGV